MFDFVLKPIKNLRLGYDWERLIRVMNTKPFISRGLSTEREIVLFFILFATTECKTSNRNDNCIFFPYILIPSYEQSTSVRRTEIQTGHEKVVEGHAWVDKVIFFF